MRQWLLATSLLAAASPAFADFNDGLKAYLAKDYPKALAEFRASAQLGQPNAQFNLGVMYFNGEGVTRDPEEAYAWFAAAEDNGLAGADKAKLKALSQLGKGQLKAASNLAQQRLSLLGQTALEKTLLPEIRVTTDNPEAHPLKRRDPRYPQNAARNMEMGFTKVIFDINEAGGVENARVVSAMPPQVFNKASLDAVSSWKYAPPKDKDGHPSRIQGAAVVLDYRLVGAQIDDKAFDKLTDALAQKAQTGNPAAQFQLAGILEWQQNIDGWRFTEIQGKEHYGAPELSAKPSSLKRPKGLPQGRDSGFKYRHWRFAFRLDEKGKPVGIRQLDIHKQSAEDAGWNRELMEQIAKRHYHRPHDSDNQGLYVLSYNVYRNSEEETVRPALPPQQSARDMVLKAAQGGLALAQYQVGSDLLYGRSCVVDRRKGLDWLTYAAQQGQVEAQELLGMELVKGGETQRDWAKAKAWLEKAAAQGSWLAKRELARVLATADAASLRDPSRSLALAQEVVKDHEDPNSYDVLADAWLAKGDKREARHYLEEALAEAKDRGWDASPYQQRLNTF
ncbi:TonB family protein [Gallaecimonas kandeliae]|uniref:TonB family protein n=1 Tax=Gallaecimonas kandeliae TaxID=3029055 RepID=UPI002649C3BF|nr:TonB family protein [Gallaecimonas kandeliae]WKE65821.1 TonB family protein [Gallaecimonas kandeliae]